MTDNHATPLLQEQSFNINHSVKVKLTERGKEIYVADLMNNYFTRAEANESMRRITDANGYIQVQLYRLMALFGPHMPTFATMDPRFIPFETEIILLPDPLDVGDTSDRLL